MKSETPLYFSFRNIWKIAYPIILGSLAQDIITVVDTAFIGRLGEVELGGAAIGSIFYLAIVMVGWGFGIGVQIMIARRYGEGDEKAIRKLFIHSAYLLVIFAILIFSTIHFFNEKIFNLLVQSEAIVNESLNYIQIRIFGLFAAFLNINFRAFFIGTAKTKIISYTTILMALVNISLDYFFIFGFGSIPAMAIKGAALASVIAEYCALIYFIVYTAKNKTTSRLKLFNIETFEANITRRILSIATPTLLQNFMSFSAWFVFFIMVEKLGETPLAISNIIRSIYIVVLLPIMGFSSATNTLVSYSIGKNNSQYIWKIIGRSMLLAQLGIALLVGLAILFPIPILSTYTSIDHIINESLPAFYIILLASFTIAFGFITFQAVSGTGNTKTALLIEIAVLTIYLSGVFIIVNSNNANIAKVWSMEIIYGTGLGIFSAAYLKFGDWRNKIL